MKKIIWSGAECFGQKMKDLLKMHVSSVKCRTKECPLEFFFSIVFDVLDKFITFIYNTDFSCKNVVLDTLWHEQNIKILDQVKCASRLIRV